MVKVFRHAAALVFIVMAAGCGWFQPETEPIPAIRFGVLNSLPKFPCSIKASGDSDIRAARGVIETVRDIMLTDRVTEMAVQFLEEKGYEAVIIEDWGALESGRVDMLIEIAPVEVHGMPGDTGYGFCNVILPWEIAEQPPRSFVATQLVMRREHSPRVFRTKPLVRFSTLMDGCWSGTWEELSGEDKECLEDSLRDNMAKAMYIQFTRLKI